MIFDRLYNAYMAETDSKMSTWDATHDKTDEYRMYLCHRENYEEIFNNFGVGTNRSLLIGCEYNEGIYHIASGINCPNFHGIIGKSQYKSYLSKLKTYYSDTCSIPIDDLKIPKRFGICGEYFDDHVIPMLFYKHGLLTDTIIGLDTKIETVLEIGAGYGGLCHIIVKRLKNVKYIILDIQPIILISAFFLHSL